LGGAFFKYQPSSKPWTLAATFMRHFLFIILTIWFTSCNNDNSFDKGYYEKVSRLKFPDKYKVLETFDNGEWLTGTVLEIDSITLKKFVIENHFDTLQNLNDIHLASNSYLTRHKANFVATRNIYFVSRSINKNNWTYVADLNANKLWTEIGYPDWSGR